MEQRGPLTYLVQMENGQLWRRHIDHLRQLGELTSMSDATSSSPEWPAIEKAVTPQVETPSHPVNVSAAENPSPTTATADTSSSSSGSWPMPRRYPTRQRKPVERLTY